MKMLIANLMALGVLGATTAAAAQDLTPAQREARGREAATPAQRNMQRNGPTQGQRDVQRNGPTQSQRYVDQHGGLTPAEQNANRTPGQRYVGQHGYTPAQRDAGMSPGQRYVGQHGYTPAQQQARRSQWGQWQRNVQATRRYQAGFYRAPPGFAYRRWGYGQRLPGIYFSQNYWLTNWAIYGLFAPSDGLVWVRYGPDALLVDRYSGEIVQVRYGVFY